MADVVSIQDEGVLAVLNQGQFDFPRNSRFAGAGQACKPDHAALLAELVFALGVGEFAIVPGDILTDRLHRATIVALAVIPAKAGIQTMGPGFHRGDGSPDNNDFAFFFLVGGFDDVQVDAAGDFVAIRVDKGPQFAAAAH